MSLPPIPPKATADSDPTLSWNCKSARKELLLSIGGVYAGFLVMGVSSETAVGPLVGAVATLHEVGDVILKAEAADHACETGRYAKIREAFAK